LKKSKIFVLIKLLPIIKQNQRFDTRLNVTHLSFVNHIETNTHQIYTFFSDVNIFYRDSYVISIW